MYPISEQTQVYGRTLTKLSFPRNHGQSMIGYLKGYGKWPIYR